MLSYHNNPAVKAKAIALAQSHIEQDMLYQSVYVISASDTNSGHFKGCSIGCMAISLMSEKELSHYTYGREPLVSTIEKELNLPRWLIDIEEIFFENLPFDDAQKWHLEFFQATPVGVNLNKLASEFYDYVREEYIKLAPEYSTCTFNIVTALTLLCQLQRLHQLAIVQHKNKFLELLKVQV